MTLEMANLLDIQFQVIGVYKKRAQGAKSRRMKRNEMFIVSLKDRS